MSAREASQPCISKHGEERNVVNSLLSSPLSPTSHHGKHRNEVVQIPFSITPKPTKTLKQNINALTCCDQPSITDPCRSPHQLTHYTSLQHHANACHRTFQNYMYTTPRTLWLKLPFQAPTLGLSPEIPVLLVHNKLFPIHARLARAPTPRRSAELSTAKWPKAYRLTALCFGASTFFDISFEFVGLLLREEPWRCWGMRFWSRMYKGVGVAQD